MPSFTRAQRQAGAALLWWESRDLNLDMPGERAMEPEKSSAGRFVRKNRFPTLVLGSDRWMVVLLAVSALALIVLGLALTGHVLGR